MSAGSKYSDDSISGPAAVSKAVRAAARFQPHLVSVDGGLLAAIPVVAVLGGGLAAGAPVPGVTMGAGAMLVGIAWRTTGGRPPLGVMAADALVMALSTFVGCVTGSVAWVHIAVLCLWSVMGGLLVGLGNRGGAVGTQAIIAVVVFGRFSEPALQALGLAGLVLAGGMAQVVFLSVVRWPLPLRGQRAATATAYRELARLASGPDEGSTIPAAAALDEAQATLASPTMFGDAALMTLRSMVSEGYRMRVQLMAVHTLLRQQLSGPGSAEATIRRALTLTATALASAAEALQGQEGANARLAETVAELDGVVAVARADEAGPGAQTSTGPLIARRLAAVAGQLRAVNGLAPSAGRAGGLRGRRPYRRTNRPFQRWKAGLAQLRADASVRSPAGRHALRLAVIVPVAALIARQLPLHRGYWVAVSAATVLRPEFGATFTRGTERAAGTVLGVGLAGAIAVVLHPAGGITVLLVALLGWAGYSVFPASFAAGFAFITALVVFLLNVVAQDTLATASARLLDSLVGGSVGLLAYALWPTWARGSAWQALAEVAAAENAYVDRILQAAEQGHRPSDAEMRDLARRARVARTNAESAVAVSLSEPDTRRIDADQSQGALGAMRRLIQAAHVIRLDLQDDRAHPALPGLAPVRGDLATLMTRIESDLRDRPFSSSPDAPLPDLRARYLAFEHAAGDDPEIQALLAELDEIVDAADSLAVIAGLLDVDEAPSGAA